MRFSSNLFCFVVTQLDALLLVFSCKFPPNIHSSNPVVLTSHRELCLQTYSSYSLHKNRHVFISSHVTIVMSPLALSWHHGLVTTGTTARALYGTTSGCRCQGTTVMADSGHHSHVTAPLPSSPVMSALSCHTVMALPCHQRLCVRRCLGVHLCLQMCCVCDDGCSCMCQGLCLMSGRKTYVSRPLEKRKNTFPDPKFFRIFLEALCVVSVHVSLHEYCVCSCLCLCLCLCTRACVSVC